MPSLGAGGSLVAAALVAALALSGVVAFRGWPGGSAGAAAHAATLAPERGAVKPAHARHAIRLLVAAAAARRITGRPAPARAAAPAPPVTRAPVARRRAVAPPPPPAPAPRGMTRPAPAAPAPAPSPAAATPARKAPAKKPGRPATPLPVPVPVRVPAHPVQRVVDTVQQKLPPVPQPLLGAVDDTAAAVDGVLNGAGLGR